MLCFVFVFSYLFFFICAHPMSCMYTHVNCGMWCTTATISCGPRSFECIMSCTLCHTLSIYRNCGVKQQQKESYHSHLARFCAIKRIIVMFCHLGMILDDGAAAEGFHQPQFQNIQSGHVESGSGEADHHQMSQLQGNTTCTSIARKGFEGIASGCFVGTWQKQGFKKWYIQGGIAIHNPIHFHISGEVAW